MLKFLIIPLALTTVTPVLSATPWDSEPVVQRVSYADLNLASAEGRATLQHRIDRAVRMACPDLASTDLREHMSGRRCARDAQKGAQIQLAALQNRKDTQLALAGR